MLDAHIPDDHYAAKGALQASPIRKRKAAKQVNEAVKLQKLNDGDSKEVAASGAPTLKEIAASVQHDHQAEFVDQEHQELIKNNGPNDDVEQDDLQQQNEMDVANPAKAGPEQAVLNQDVTQVMGS